MDELAAYFEEAIVRKVIKCAEDEAIGLMLSGEKPKPAMKSSGLYYETGQSQYRAVCKRVYRKKSKISVTSKRAQQAKKKKCKKSDGRRCTGVRPMPQQQN